MDVRSMRNAVLGARVVNALKSRNMDAYYVETKEEAVAKALELMPKGSTISWGGTMSVAEAGLMDAIRNGDYTLYDRDQAETAKEREEMMHQAFFADFFLGSTNAVSEDGVLVNIDGVANRVAAYAYGPKNVQCRFLSGKLFLIILFFLNLFLFHVSFLLHINLDNQGILLCTG